MSSTTITESTGIRNRARHSPCRRLCIFSFYDANGIADDYVIYFLKELGKFVEKIILYSNGPIAKNSEIALNTVVSEIIIRPNEGFDVMAYKQGLELIDFDRQSKYDELLMVNDTCYGPVYPFSELFTEMDERDCDFWGVTAHLEMRPNPFTGTGILPYHLNANFIAVREPMFRSSSFRSYWNNIESKDSYESAILGHEAYFTKHFTSLDYKVSSYINSKKYGTHYPAILDIDEVITDRCPLIKRRALFHDPRFLEHYAADLPRAIRILRSTSDYDEAMIWRNVTRVAELRSLNTNAALTSIVGDARLRQGASPEYGNIAVCAHVYYPEMLAEILDRTDTIPVPYDFIATTETEEKRKLIESAASMRPKIRKVIVRVVEQNRGRDMSSLFITCRDLFLDDRYALVCRLHTKKSPQVAAGRGNLFKRHMFENLLNSPGFTANVLDMFYEKPWIGLACPPVVHISYWTLGHAWYVNREPAEKIRELLDLKVPFDSDTPVAPYGTMFWFRPKALRKLFAHQWKWTDFNAEPRHVDGGLAHVMERLIGYVAQDAGYTTEQILSSHLGGQNYAMLEYKLQKLMSFLPNSDFSYHCKILEDWKLAGYPLSMALSKLALPDAPAAPMATSVVVPPPASVRKAYGDLILASKIALAQRAPRVFRTFRPAYRLLTRRRSI